MSTATLLEQELETFEREKESLLAQHEHEFVLIHGEHVLGIFKDEMEAVAAGENSGESPFLVQPIERNEEVIFLSSPYIEA